MCVFFCDKCPCFECRVCDRESDTRAHTRSTAQRRPIKTHSLLLLGSSSPFAEGGRHAGANKAGRLASPQSLTGLFQGHKHTPTPTCKLLLCLCPCVLACVSGWLSSRTSSRQLEGAHARCLARAAK